MTQIVKVTASGEEHGHIGTVANSEPDNGFKHLGPEAKVKAEKLRKEEAKIVKARYVNHQESATGRLAMSYCRWGGDPITKWRFIHGQEYEVPLGLVNQVNETYFNKRSQKDEENTPVSKKDGSIRIHEFLPIGF